jgi:hypothetical protein
MGSIVRSTGYKVLHRPVELASLIGIWLLALRPVSGPHSDIAPVYQALSGLLGPTWIH